MLIISNFLLWVVVALQAVALIALARHIRNQGYGMGNVFRARRQVTETAPDPVPFPVPANRPEGVTLLVYMAEDCTIGRHLAEDAGLMAKAENMRLVIARDGQQVSHWVPPHNRAAPSPATRKRNETGALRRRKNNAQAMTLPHAMIIDGDGLIVAQGEVSSRSDLVHLLASVTLGFPATDIAENKARISSPPSDSGEKVTEYQKSRG